MPRIHISPTDPERTLDRTLAAFRDGAEIVLAPGRYLTGGAWAHGANWERMQAPGTRIRVDNGAADISIADWAPRSITAEDRPERDLWVWTYGHGAEISDITFDGREKDFSDRNIKAGVRGVGSSKFRNCRVRGLRGVPGSIEAFGFSSTGPEGGSDWSGLTVEKCAPGSYVSNFNVGHIGANGRLPAKSTLSRCLANAGTGNWIGFGVNENVDLLACDSVYVTSHIYNDTGPTRNISVRGGSARHVQKLLSLIVDELKPISAKHGIVITGMTVDLIGDAAGEARVVELWNQHASHADIGGVVILESKITSTAAQTYAWSIAAPGLVMPVTIAACSVPKDMIGTHPAGCLINFTEI